MAKPWQGVRRARIQHVDFTHNFLEMYFVRQTKGSSGSPLPKTVSAGAQQGGICAEKGRVYSGKIQSPSLTPVSGTVKLIDG